MTEASPISRKDQHLDVVLDGRGRHARDAGFDAVRFVHEALPDLDHDKIDLGADFLGRRLKAPLLISAMTGGPEEAERINLHIAEACAHHRIALSVGSQRIAVEAGGSQVPNTNSWIDARIDGSGQKTTYIQRSPRISA